MFIDIHNHTLFGVDDGPKERETAEKMLVDAKEQGAEAVILTPHYRRGMFSYPVEIIEANFIELKKFAQSIGIFLSLGCEYHVDSDMIANFQTGRCRTLADSDYVLTEYSHQAEYNYMAEQTHRLISCGYFPVIAHVERYKCLQKKPELCAELSDMGAMIQINADSILGMSGWKEKQFCKTLLKRHLADVIASDAHDRTKRACHMEKSRIYIEKKFGKEYAELLFMKNPHRILNNR